MNQRITRLATVAFLLAATLPLKVSAELSSGTTKVPIENPLGDVDSIPELVNNIVTVILGLVGAIALGMFIYGGMLWMTSFGNQERVGKGKETLIWATFGLLIIFMSYAILNAIFAAFTGR